MMSWDGIWFGMLCLFLGYNFGSMMTKSDMEAKANHERERELEALKEERKKWIDHGRALERQIREANENSK
jgi:hypothetical protein